MQLIRDRNGDYANKLFALASEIAPDRVAFQVLTLRDRLLRQHPTGKMSVSTPPWACGTSMAITQSECVEWAAS